MWRRWLGHKPLKKCSWGLLHDISLGHLLLGLPLLFWFVDATHTAFWEPTRHHAFKETGEMTSYVMTMVFITSSKSHSLVSLVTGLSFERLVPFHLTSALLTVWMACLHGIQIGYYHKGDKESHDSEHHDGDDGDHDDHDDEEDEHEHKYRILHEHHSIHAYLGSDPNMWKYFWDNEMNRTGATVLFTLAIMVVTSAFHTPFRKYWFEGWLITHVTGASVILLAGILHGADIFWYALVWWILDGLIRYGLMAGMRYPKQAKVTRVAENLTKVEWPKADCYLNKFQYEHGQFVQIAIPSIGLWEFHPFSIASAPEDPSVTLYIRALPSPKTWTRQLMELAAPRDVNKISTNSVRVFIEGPYGSLPSILEQRNEHKYSMAVFICGGIGATPCHSIARSMLVGSSAPPSLKKVLYIWSIRNEDMINAIPPPTVAHAKNDSNDDAADGIEMVERPKMGDAGDDVFEDEDHDMLDTAVSTTRRPLEVQTDIYISQVDKFLDGYNDDEIDNQAKQDQTTSDQSYRIHRGSRPDVHAILQKVQEEASENGWGRIFVMGCGPTSLLEQIEVACQRNETNVIEIDFHPEVFRY